MARPLIVDGRNFLDPKALRVGGLRLRGHRPRRRAPSGAGRRRLSRCRRSSWSAAKGRGCAPLTASVPKPALTLVDRPFLAYMVEWLAGHGVDEVVLACGFLPDVLREALGEAERSGCAIRYVAEPEPLGTAGAIRFAADALGDDLDERFLALNGDVLTDLDLTRAARRPRRARGAGDARPAPGRGLRRLRPRQPRRRRRGARVPREDRRAGARRGQRGHVRARALRARPDPAPGEKVSIEREVFPRLVGDGLYGLLLDGYWMDIGTPERYLQATWDILEGAVETLVEPTGPGVLVDPGRGGRRRAPRSARGR